MRRNSDCVRDYVSVFRIPCSRDSTTAFDLSASPRVSIFTTLFLASLEDGLNGRRRIMNAD